MGRHHVLHGEPLFVPSPSLFRDASTTSMPKGQLGFNLIKGSFFPCVSSKPPGVQGLAGNVSETCEYVVAKNMYASALTVLCADRTPLLR